jgi:hypothetical protein
MPGLAVALSLQMSSLSCGKAGSDDVVSFITSQLLGNDPAVRNWFSQFVKSAQKVPRLTGLLSFIFVIKNPRTFVT